MKLATAFTLGRVSNLPTVWSNVLAGLVLAEAEPVPGRLLPLLAAASLLYLAGMFLNDAFDAAWDAAQRPQRPIPAGDTASREVFTWAGVMIALALALLLATSIRTFVWGLALTTAIVLYDWRHKQFGLSPWLMGLCRMLVYLSAASVVAVNLPVALAGSALLAYVAAITFSARSEHLGRVGQRWPLVLLFAPAAPALALSTEMTVAAPYLAALLVWLSLQLRLLFSGGDSVGRAVAGLIAGIALVDAVFIAAAGEPGLALWAIAAWAATLGAQRVWAGT